MNEGSEGRKEGRNRAKEKKGRRDARRTRTYLAFINRMQFSTSTATWRMDGTDLPEMYIEYDRKLASICYRR